MQRRKSEILALWNPASGGSAQRNSTGRALNSKWFDKPLDRPFDGPFDRLTVLSRVEGLTTLSQVEGQIQITKIPIT
jgi:hypothetical protein